MTVSLSLASPEMYMRDRRLQWGEERKKV